MKILHLISGGDTGGAKTHLLTLLAAMIKGGIDAELLCIMEGVFTREARELGIKVKIIEQKNRLDFSAIGKIKEHIRSGGYDIVHCHGARANYIAMFVRSAGVPMLTTLHSDYKLDFKGNRYKHLVFTPINSIALRKFKYILAVTDSFKKMLVERGFKAERLYTIYNGVNFDSPPLFIPKEEFMAKYGLEYDKNRIYIGIAARLYAVKGVRYFIRAAEAVSAKNKNITFLIAGNGEEEAELKAYVNEHSLDGCVKFLGFVKDINSFYNVIDINTLTSLSESFPYSLLEGAKMKKATVAAAVGGIPEMIENGTTGFLFKAKDIADLSDKLLRLANDESLREKFGESFFEKAQKDFSDTKMFETHKKIYTDILEKEKTK